MKTAMQAMRRMPRDPETVLADLRAHQQFCDDIMKAVSDVMACWMPSHIVIIDGELRPTPLPILPEHVRVTLTTEYERIGELEYELKDAMERRNAERDEREERRRDGRS